MTDKLGNTDRPDAPVVDPGSLGDLDGRLTALEGKVGDLEKAIHILIDGLEEQLEVRAGLKDGKREY